MKRLYEITRTLSSKNSNPSRPVKDKDGNIILGKEQPKARWAEYFEETFNQPATSVPPAIPPPNKLLDINTSFHSKTEIVKAIKSLKSGKVAGPDGSPPKTIKADIQTSTEMLYLLLCKIWGQKRVLGDWKRGHFVKLPKEEDLSSCNNWRGIMPLSIPGKILSRITLERLRSALDKTL